MTTRDQMRENNENLSWCKPLSYLDGKVVVAINEGSIDSIQVDGRDVEHDAKGRHCGPCYSDATIERVARMILGEDYDFCSGYTPAQMLKGAGGAEELPCRLCPWFDVCAAMDEEIEEF